MKLKKPRIKYMNVAVCALLISAIGLLITGCAKEPGGTDVTVGEATTGKKSNNPSPAAIQNVNYPKAFAFDNLKAKREVWEQNPVEESFFEALNEFSYKTSAIVLSESGKNINYSPVSLYFALSLATSGANGDTAAELLELLGVSDTRELNHSCGNLYRLLYRDNIIGKLKIANSVWMDNDMNGEPILFKDEFVKNAAENFYASSHTVDFADKKTGKAMADWVSLNTNGTLAPAIETSPEQILSILNTIYFYDQWTDRFDKSNTDEDIFHLSDGSDVKCDFMNQTFGSAGFTKGDGFTRAGLSLKNGGRMVFILPDEGVSPYDLVSSSGQMQETFEGGEGFNGQVVWKIPKFSFGSKLEMSSVLKSLGVNSAFKADADFSGITDQMAFITEVLQETHIAIDEKGVEASAFTQIMYAGSALPQGRADMILDRPFIYGITTPQGNLLFVGICENPAE